MTFIILTSCATGSSLVDKNIIKPGMTKLDLNFVLAYRTFWDQVSIPTAYREYFHHKKRNSCSDKKNKDVYYVLKMFIDL